ncbi:hypothetical protein IJH72_02620 [Candidatus Saccharibacteria bacterium]|nr:hypothetical protein [Candidatus Saccharibacteria bacterium]MBR0372805.1 hypothetical protein [Candidatus Saccharibacteria bacterium]
MKYRKGDTLIEVMLAVGIFSMIAVAIVSVMSEGTSSAQTALETTLTREEIDTQAEALRFIQTSYIADRNSASEKYQKIWETITGRAIDLSEPSANAEQNAFLQFSPSSCGELYSDTWVKKKAFIIDPRALGDNEKDAVEDTIKTFSDNVLKEATTYPRLVYASNGTIENSDSLVEDKDTTKYNLYQAEGIYIIGVKDPGNTRKIDNIDPNATQSAYYDFYIRACWYGSDANEPSTISTVIRLFDPAIME